MSDAIISAKEAYRRTHKNISRVFDLVNRAIETAIGEGKFTFSVYMTDAEYQIAAPHLTDYKITKLERSGSQSFHYLLDYTHAGE